MDLSANLAEDDVCCSFGNGWHKNGQALERATQKATVS